MIKMIAQKNNRMRLVLITVIGIIILAAFLFIQIVWVKRDLIDFSWGAVFGILSAILATLIRQEYQKIK